MANGLHILRSAAIHRKYDMVSRDETRGHYKASSSKRSTALPRSSLEAALFLFSFFSAFVLGSWLLADCV